MSDSKQTVDRTLSMWVVYEHPKDFPNQFVARRHLIDQGKSIPTTDVFLSEDIYELRTRLRTEYPGLVCLARNPKDDLVIVETWI